VLFQQEPEPEDTSLLMHHGNCDMENIAAAEEFRSAPKSSNFFVGPNWRMRVWVVGAGRH